MKKIREKINKYQSGQIIYFVAITFVVMLGFAGLAIDGGRLYSDRRITQGTADTVAFTGALVIGQYVIDNPAALIWVDALGNNVDVKALAIAAATDRAAQNGYIQSDPNKDVSIFITGPYFDDGVYYLVTVELRSEIPPTFIQLVYDGPLVNTGRAVAKARPRQSLAFGFSMYASDPTGCKGVEFGGTADILVEGGGIFSNSDACSASCNSLVAGGGPLVEVIGGDINVVGCVELNGGSTLSPAPIEGATPQTKPPMLPPNCIDNIDIDESKTFSTVMGDYGSSYAIIPGGLEFLSPGRYDQIKILGGDVFLAPGLYCIGSGGLSMTSGSIHGTGVTIYVLDGDVAINGGFAELSAPTDELIDGDDQYWTGMLFYMIGDGLISLGGNGDMVFTGTILALEEPAIAGAKCDLNGNGDSMGYDVQLICWSIKYTGTPTSYLRYYEPENYYYPATIDLIE